MEKEIIYIYQNSICSIEYLAKKYKVGKIKIKKILIDNDIPIRVKGNQNKIKTPIPFGIDIQNKIIVCKRCGKEFKDIENKSGSITEHIKICFPEIEIPTKFKRSQYKKQYGEYWHFQFFDIKDNIDKPKLNCPECDWFTYDLTNRTGSLTKHIKKVHRHITDFLSIHPNYLKYFNVFSNDKNREVLFSTDNTQENYVTCKLCNKKMKVVSNTHLKTKHNITPEKYKLMFPNEILVSNKSNNIFKRNLLNSNMNVEPTWTSSGEIEIMNFIRGLGFNVEKGRNRKILNGKEIDIIIPDKKIGIEYNGLYFHTESMGKNSTYHLNKTIECSNLGYNLIHIFEDEWMTKKALVMKKIEHILNVSNSIKIGARKVVIKKISSKDKSDFLNQNHIQGNDKSTIFYGSFYNDMMVGVMTFNKNRNMTKNIINQYELSRYCIHQDYIINGMGSKFLNNFINDYNPKTIISFADRRWTPNHEDNLYTKLGFKMISIINPKYYYYNSKINRYKRYHKFGFGKNNLKKKHPELDYTKSEKYLMKDLGFERIWDCGLYKYELTVQKKGE